MKSDVAFLRPLGAGELLDQAFRLYRRNFLTFIGIVALVQIPLILAQLVVGVLAANQNARLFEQIGNDSLPATQLSFFSENVALIAVLNVTLAILSFILVQGLATAVLTRTVADNYLGQKSSIIEAYRKVGRAWLSLAGALVIALLLFIVIFIWWIIVPCIGWITGLGMFYFMSLVVIPIIAPVVVLEERSATGAWRRAWDLTRRRFWPVLGFVFILFLLGQLLVAGPAQLGLIAFEAIAGDPFSWSDPTQGLVVQQILQTAITLIFSLIYLPLQLTAITLLYFDLRVRTEGFDLAVLAQSASGEMVDATSMATGAPQVYNERLVTSGELGNFAAISVGVGVLLVIIGVIFSSFVPALTGF